MSNIIIVTTARAKHKIPENIAGGNKKLLEVSKDSMHNYEKNILRTVRNAFDCAGTRDSVNKVYRQSRNWSRYHHYFGNGCTEERMHELNGIFKLMRIARMNELSESAGNASIEDN